MVVDGTLPPACAGRGEIRPPSAEAGGIDSVALTARPSVSYRSAYAYSGTEEREVAFEPIAPLGPNRAARVED